MLSESDAARILILVRLGVAGSTSASEKTNERLCQQIVFKLFKTDVVYRYGIKISLKLNKEFVSWMSTVPVPTYCKISIE